jgi:SAM-dependent methyltransferase
VRNKAALSIFIPSKAKTLSDIWSVIGHQLKCPAGPQGRLAGRIMSVINKQPNHLAIRALSLQPRDTVLELGFGPGVAIKEMAALAPQGLVLGIDQSLDMLVQASRRNRVEIERERVQLRLGNFCSLPWAAESIDKILAVNVVYFFGRDAREVREARRILKPGGLMAVYVTDKSTMAHWKFSGPDTHVLFGPDSLRGLLTRGGFSEEDISLGAVMLSFGIRGLLAIARKQA